MPRVGGCVVGDTVESRARVDEVREPDWAEYRAELKRKLRSSQAGERERSRALAMAARGSSIAGPSAGRRWRWARRRSRCSRSQS